MPARDPAVEHFSPGLQERSIAGRWSGRDGIRVYRIALTEESGRVLSGTAAYFDADRGPVTDPVMATYYRDSVAIVIARPDGHEWILKGALNPEGAIRGWWWISGRPEQSIVFTREPT